MKISYRNKDNNTINVEGNTNENLIDNIPELTSEQKDIMKSELGKEYTLSEIALYIYTELKMDILEVLPDSCGCTSCGCETEKTAV